MPAFQNFLVVDSDTDGRVLIVRTLLRVFPQAAIVEVQDFETAVSLAGGRHYDAIIAHRAIGADAGMLVSALRRADASVPIVAMSGIDRTRETLAAGANRFLKAEQWLLVGTVVQELLPQAGGAVD
jgi:DNA-binding response OmpR family regulator